MDPKCDLARRASAWLAVRSVVWAVLLPGVVAGYVPWRFFGLGRRGLDPAGPLPAAGLAGISVGVVLLALCILEFARSGRGTLAPLDPPRELVVQGLYRYVRNPMYLSVTIILLGEALVTRSRGLVTYWAVWFLLVNLFVLGYEEPALRRRFGESYDRYREAVGRWLPRVRARPPRGNP